MNIYEKPTVKIVTLKNEDIITSSGLTKSSTQLESGMKSGRSGYFGLTS